MEQMGMQKDSQLVKFYDQVVVDEAAFNEEGKPVYKEVTYVRVFSPGNAREVFDQPASDEHKGRWPEAWQTYINEKSGVEDEGIDGFPIDDYPLMDRLHSKILKSEGVKTLEQFTGIPDDNCRNLGAGFLELKYRAIDYLKNMNDTTHLNKMSKENKELKDKVEKQEALIKELSSWRRARCSRSGP